MWSHFTFFNRKTHFISVEIEVFNVDTHLRLLERGKIMIILKGNNDNYEVCDSVHSFFFNLRKKYYHKRLAAGRPAVVMLLGKS